MLTVPWIKNKQHYHATSCLLGDWTWCRYNMGIRNTRNWPQQTPPCAISASFPCALSSETSGRQPRPDCHSGKRPGSAPSLLPMPDMPGQWESAPSQQLRGTPPLCPTERATSSHHTREHIPNILRRRCTGGSLEEKMGVQGKRFHSTW